MSESSNELRHAIKKLSGDFRVTANSYELDCMRSRPSYIDWYYELSQRYHEAASVCEEYLVNQNIVSLVQKLKELGFQNQISDLKEFILYSEVIDIIEEQVDIQHGRES